MSRCAARAAAPRRASRCSGAVLLLARRSGVTADLTAPAATADQRRRAAPTRPPGGAGRPGRRGLPRPGRPTTTTETRVSVGGPRRRRPARAPGASRAGAAARAGRRPAARSTVEAPGIRRPPWPPPDQGPLVARGHRRGRRPASPPGCSPAAPSTRCAVSRAPRARSPGTDFWFVGSGAVVGQRGRVYLTNPEAAPAVVDVTLYGPDGPIDAPAGRGVPVAAGTQEVRLLDALAPGITRFAVHVHVRSGRVAAAVRDQQLDGLTPRGADWLPVGRAAGPPPGAARASSPARGSGACRSSRPATSDAIVKLRLVTESGSFAPAGLDVLEVRGRLGGRRRPGASSPTRRPSRCRWTPTSR